MVQNIKALGIDVFVVAPVPYAPAILWFKKKWRRQGQIPWMDCIEGIKITYPRYLCLPGQKFMIWNIFFMYWGAYPVIKILYDRAGFNLIHSYGVLPAGFAGQLTANRLNLLSACTAIGLDINVFAKRSAVMKALAKYVLANTGHIIAVGKELALEINKLQLTDQRIKVIYNGVDNKTFDIAGISHIQAKMKLGLSQNQRMVLFVGRVVREKGVYELIEAFARVSQRFPQAVLAIVGEGNEKKSLRILSSKKGIQNKVLFVGNIPQKELAWWYAASEIVVLLSYYEGLPNVIKEAMSCGKAVVAAKTVGIPELVVDDQTGFSVEPGQVDGAVAALEELLANPELGWKMGMQARSLLSAKDFNWRQTAQAYREVYLQLIKKS